MDVSLLTGSGSVAVFRLARAEDDNSTDGVVTFATTEKSTLSQQAVEKLIEYDPFTSALTGGDSCR